jgi:hypothetical protein
VNSPQPHDYWVQIQPDAADVPYVFGYEQPGPAVSDRPQLYAPGQSSTPGQSSPPTGWPPSEPPPTWPPVTLPSRRRRLGRALTVIVGALAVVIVVGAIVAIAKDTSPTPASTDTADTVTTTAAAAARNPGAATIARWWQDGGKDRAQAIRADFTAMGTAADNSDFRAVRAACAAAQRHIAAAQAYAPIPDSQAQQHWTAALAAYARGVSDCMAGVKALDAGAITRAGDEVAAGNADLAKVTGRLHEPAGR